MNEALLAQEIVRLLWEEHDRRDRERRRIAAEQTLARWKYEDKHFDEMVP